MNILNKHLYRTSTTEDQDKPAITIPFSTIQHVIHAHEKQHSYLDISRNIKKRPFEEGDLYDKNKEDVTEEIKRLRKRRVKDL